MSLGAQSLLQANLPLLQFFKGCALVVRYLHHLYNFRNSILNYWAASFVPEHRTYTKKTKKLSSAFIPHPIGGSRLGKGCEGRFHDNGDGDDDGDDDDDDGDDDDDDDDDNDDDDDDDNDGEMAAVLIMVRLMEVVVN